MYQLTRTQTLRLRARGAFYLKLFLLWADFEMTGVVVAACFAAAGAFETVAIAATGFAVGGRKMCVGHADIITKKQPRFSAGLGKELG